MKQFLPLLALCLTTSVLGAQTLHFVTQDDQDFPNVMGEGVHFPADKPGVTVEIVRLLEKELGIKVEIQRYPWARCLESELKSGNADGAFNASYKKEREAFGAYPILGSGAVDPSKRITTSTYCFYKLRDSAFQWDGKKLPENAGTIGVPAGYSIGDDLTKMGATVISAGSTEINFKNLLVKRLSLVATIEEDGDFTLAKPEFLGKIEKVTVPIISKPYYVMLSNQFVAKNPILAAKIWEAIARLRETQYKKLFVTYF